MINVLVSFVTTFRFALPVAWQWTCSNVHYNWSCRQASCLKIAIKYAQVWAVMIKSTRCEDINTIMLMHSHTNASLLLDRQKYSSRVQVKQKVHHTVLQTLHVAYTKYHIEKSYTYRALWLLHIVKGNAWR